MDGEFPLFGHNRIRYRPDAGWDVPDDLKFDDWVLIGEELGRAERDTPWAIGDWWNLGERYGKDYGERAQIVQRHNWIGPKYQTCRLYGLVAAAFKPVERFNKLDFKHHIAAASLAKNTPAEAERLLRDAVENDWSAAQLAREIRRHRIRRQVDALPGAPPGSSPENPWGIIQHFDIWQFQNADDESDYFGKLPRQIAENLLWFFTDPDQLIVDPFAGGGIMIDVAEAMGRRIWASDLSPSRPAIYQHDITTGWPENGPDQADLIFLDPPYWQQAKGRYSENVADLGNLSVDQFEQAIDQVIDASSRHLSPNGRIAYIISPTQLDDGIVIDHATDFLSLCWAHNLVVERRIIVPYQTQQATGQQVQWARDNRRLLKLYRDLVILRQNT